MSDKIFLLRLTCGYDLVSQVKRNGNNYYLKYPFRTMYTAHPTSGNTIIQLLPWLSFELFKDIENCVIDDKDVIIASECSETMASLYEQSLKGYLAKIEAGEFNNTKLKQLKEILEEDSLEEDQEGTPKTPESRKLQ